MDLDSALEHDGLGLLIDVVNHSGDLYTDWVDAQLERLEKGRRVMQNMRRKKYSEGLELTSLEINRLNPVLSPGTQLKGSAANSRCHTMVDYIYQ
jgi:hypothetical protein